jgi:hypothetical protein
MERKNLVGMLAGYYLSRFNEIAYHRFSFSSQADVHNYLANKIGVPSTSVKLWRDEFDPIHENPRKGWHMRPMAPSRVRMAEMLEGVSESGIYQLLENCIQNPDSNLVDLLDQAEKVDNGNTQTASSRGVTGAKAEELFMAMFRTGQTIFEDQLKDCRQLQCGYDFEARFSGTEAFIEVKGLKDDAGGLLFTDKEWNTAKDKCSSYFLALIRNIDADQPMVDYLRDPYSKLNPQFISIPVIQISWKVSASDFRLAANQEGGLLPPN